MKLQSAKLPLLLAVFASFLAASCDSANEESQKSINRSLVQNTSDDIVYRGFVHSAIIILRDQEMYSGELPIWEEEEGFLGAFFPVVRDSANIANAECIYPAPPMDEYGGTIAFGKPPSREFEGSFTCGKFRFDVQECAVLEIGCEARYVRVLSTSNDRFVSFQLWDECRGIYLVARSDLIEDPESWKRADHAVGGRGLFGKMSTNCRTMSDYESENSD